MALPLPHDKHASVVPSSDDDSNNSIKVDAQDAKPSFWDKLPPWVADNLRNPRSLKTFFRAWLATWVAFIIMLPQKSLTTLGFTGFFAMLASVVIPAAFPIQFFFFLISTMLIGMLLGWGFGAAAMRAGLAVRNELVVKATMEKEMKSIAGLSNPDAAFKDAIFTGIFLDTKTSAVTGVIFGIGCFFFALLRSYNPKFLIMSVFGTITLDILCSFGPLFPFSEYMLLNSVLISTSCYAAIGLILIILVFPQTMNHQFLIATDDILSKIKTLVDMQELILSARPTDLDTGSPLIAKFVGLRSEVAQLFTKLTLNSKFVALEFSWGKWSGQDVNSLEPHLLSLVSRTAALHSFARIISHPVTRSFDPPAEADSGSTDVSSTHGAPQVLTSETYLLRELRDRNRNSEAEHAVRMADVMPKIREATRDLRGACSAGIAAIQGVLDNINNRRYAFRGEAEADKKVEELADKMHDLRQALAEFKETKRLQLVEPYNALLDQVKRSKQTGPAPPLRTLFISYVFATNMITMGEGVVAMMDFVLTTASQRQKNRLWAPTSFRALAHLITSRNDPDVQGVGEDEIPDKPDENARSLASYKLDPDSRPPSNAFHHFVNFLHKIWKWVKSPEVLFGIKYAVLSVALWIPSAVKSSAHFMYQEKGIWVLIMAQTTINIYASEQIYNYILRIGGSLIGALLGLLTWYLGSAHGRGNPYGMAAAVAFISPPIVFFRVFAPIPFLPASFLLGVTWVLVVGFSWLDGHIPVFGNVGWGWSVFWRRFVTVMIGCLASFIMMMLPPKSGRKSVRLRNATTITNLSYVYQEITSAWINDKRMFPKDKKEPQPTFADQIPEFRDRILGVAAQLQALRTQTMLAKFEGGFRGEWPLGEYMNLVDTQTNMLISLTLLGSALAQLDQSKRVSYLQHTRTVNPSFIADVVSTFSIVAQSLRSGEPLSQTFHHNMLDRLFYHSIMHTATVVPGHSSALAEAHDPLHEITSYEFMFYASAVVAVFQLLDGLNELRRITAGLCGEVPLPGYDHWKEQYDRAHTTPAVGIL